MVYNHVFARWDALGERYWDEQQRAWVQTSGSSVDVEYATKHMRYENGGTQIWILNNGTWEEYNPDEEYIIDMQEDWETGALLVYNNDFGRYEPYGEPFQPAGVGYMVTNEFEMVYLMYDDGTMVCLENYGDGAFLSTEATGYSLIQMRGEKSYYDSSNGFWWSYGWDNWSFSIDGGSTWKEAPNLDIRVAADRLCNDYVGVFDGREWTRMNGRLEFMDKDFAQAGWMGMDQFYYDLYDGVGYDGEPLRLVVQEIYERESEEPVREFFQNLKHTLPPSGHEENDNSVPAGTLDSAYLYVFGEWTDGLIGKFTIPNPSTVAPDAQWFAENGISVVFQSDRAAGEKGIPASFFVKEITDYKGEVLREEAIGTNVLYRYFKNTGYSLGDMVGELEALQHCLEADSGKKVEVENLAIIRHGTFAEYPGHFKIGTTRVDWSTLCYHLPLADALYYKKLFERLNTVMKDGGQIQHYGCNMAGGNPFHDMANEWDRDWNYFSWEFRSYKARCMLATIASLTNCQVFASSDAQHIYLDEVEKRPAYSLSGAGNDFCLEFGVGPDGIQLEYWKCSQEVWNLPKRSTNAWRVVGEQEIPRSIQMKFDNAPPSSSYSGTNTSGAGLPTKGTDETAGTKYTIWRV